MRKISLALASCLLVLASVTYGGPETGKPVEKKDILTANGSKTYTLTLKGGERSLVTAWGDENAVLALYLFDQDGNCVRRDDMGTGKNRSKCAVDWFPRQTQTVRVEVRNLAPVTTRLTVIVR